VVSACLESYLDSGWTAQNGENVNPIRLNLPESIYEDLEKVQILACGTSWHASLIGKYLIEQLAGIPTMVQYASEFRYAPAPIQANTLTIGVTQSGETADTLAALETEKHRRSSLEAKYRAQIIGITNRPESTLAGMVDQIINTQAGIEIGVAATKSFTAQLLGFYLLAIDLSYRRRTLPLERIETILETMRSIPRLIEMTLEKQEKAIEELAHEFNDTQDFIFLGRGINFPIALKVP
jgi:glucosamine--fructose-6-phosphate aminotransferase (isomerizing)